MLPCGWSILGLEEQISPIFGLTFMELFEPAVILGIAIGASTVFLAWRHQIIQKKTNSVNVSMNLLKRFEDKDFRDVSDFLATDKTPSDDWDKENELLKLMNYFEDMGLYEDEGVLKIKHIIQMHRDTLRLIKENKHTKKLLEEHRKKDPKFYYIFLTKLLEKV